MSFQVPYSRPTALSDPYFDHGPEYCRQVLEKPDESLDWADFQNLLGPFLPAGKYEESVYFLPLAFDYLIAHEDDALDLVDSPIWFISNYATELSRDGVIENARQNIIQLLTHWTSSFRVVHFDQQACAAKGWCPERRPYFDFVTLSESLDCAIQSLIEFATHADLAVQFVSRLAQHGGDPMKAAWFLELIRRAAQDLKVQAYSKDKDDPSLESYLQYHMRHHGVDLDTTVKTQWSDAILELMTDRELIESAAAVVVEKLAPRESSPTYWNDTLRTVVGI